MNIARAIKFIKTDIWRIRERDLPRAKSLFLRLLRIVLLSLRGLAEDRCQLRASALTFYSLLSVVPALAMVFGIAKGFGFERALEKLLLEKLEGQEEVVLRIVDFAHGLLENVRGSLIASVGLVILFWAVIMILSHIESAFNDLWGIKRPRSFGRKITDYLAFMLIGPLLLVASSTMTVVITSGARLALKRFDFLGALSPAIFLLLSLLPYCVLWVLFTFLYLFIPNTRINFKSGALAGIIAGTLYQVFQWAYINFQIGVAKYNAIYGSFAALPLFFVWLQLSWLIVLFGAEISFAHQNVDTFEFEQDCRTVSHSFKRLLTLRVAHLLVQHFSEGQKDLTAARISQTLEIPILLVHQILYELVASGLVAEVKADEDRAAVYQPARDPETMTLKSVIDALEQRGTGVIPVAPSEELDRISASLRAFSDLVEKSPANRRLREI